ncbi:methylated-DNA--[protein]-cysteine S-methyltransferase, partial [Helicobacter pylori]
NNPISLIVPCHRVVRKNGALGGYNGGIEVKKWLLEFESKILNQQAKNPLIS